MAEVLVIGKKISEMGLVNEVTGEEKIPTSALGDKAVTTSQLLAYVNNNGVAQWGRIGGDITNQVDLQNQFTQERDILKSYTQDQVSQQQEALQDHIDETNEAFEYILENGAALPYDESIEYAEGAPVLKDGVIQYKVGGEFKSRDSVSVPTYNSAVDGVSPVTGVADGSYFNVRSSNDESYVDEYQNVGGSAVATGNRYLSAVGVERQNKSASTVVDANGKSQQEINDRTVHIEDYGAVSGGVIDCTAAFNLAKVVAKSRGVPITARDDAEYLINGVCYFDCDLSGGVYLLGDSADMQLKVESDDVYNIRATFKNVSGIDTKQALICISSDGVNRRGDVRIDCKFYGFLQGVYGRYLRRFHILPTAYAYSRNTVAGRIAEAHFACVHTDLYIAQGESDGSVLGYSSGAGIVTDIYKCIARNSSDHGIYSSSPTNKRLTIFDNCITEDTGGSGQKCFSNGDVWMINPTAHRIGKVALLPVGNRVFIRGGSVKDSVLSAVYQIGKEVGAGVNTFEYLEVDGLNAVNVGDHFVRVAGAEYIGKVVLKNLTGDTERALLNIATDVNVPTIEIENCPVLCKPTAEAVINVLNSTNPAQKISIKGNVQALTNSANIIDVNTLNLTIDASFDFITAPRLIRNRNTSGVCNIFRAEINSGSTTSGLVLADSGFFTNARNVPTVNNNLKIIHTTSAPTSGNFTKGSIAYNSNASVNGVLGWYCTASGSPGTWQAFGIIADANLRTQSTTTANLNNVSNAINTTNKYLGREVYDTTVSKFMKATGQLSTDSWISTDGETTITPA